MDGFIDEDFAVHAVFKHLVHNKFNDCFRDLTITQIKKYMYSLFTSLEDIHKLNIVHRDVKPDNFLYNFHTNEFMLIDFGLAEIVNALKTSSMILVKRIMKIISKFLH